MSNIARSNANASGPRPTYVNSLNDKTMVKELQPPFGTMSTNPNNHKQISKLAIENKQYNIEQPMIKEQAKREAERIAEEKRKEEASKPSLFGMIFGSRAPVVAPVPTGAAAPVASNSAGSKFVSVGGRRSRKNKSKKSSKKSKKSSKKSYKKSKKAKSNRK